jgi:hypothetical protein
VFPKLKISLKGSRLLSPENIQDIVKTILKGVSENDFSRVSRRVTDVGMGVLWSDGEFFEGLS